MPLKESLYLIGFMGAGKTSVGQALSVKTGIPVVDLDEKIEEVANMKIRDIFEQYGEEHFRDLETRILKQPQAEPMIITTGGGVVLKEENRLFLKETGRVIFLQCEPEEVFKRIGQDPNRPLLKNKTVEDIKEMYKTRLLYYSECATITIDTTNRDIDEIVNDIQKWMNE